MSFPLPPPSPDKPYPPYKCVVNPKAFDPKNICVGTDIPYFHAPGPLGNKTFPTMAECNAACPDSTPPPFPPS